MFLPFVKKNVIGDDELFIEHFHKLKTINLSKKSKLKYLRCKDMKNLERIYNLPPNLKPEIINCDKYQSS